MSEFRVKTRADDLASGLRTGIAHAPTPNPLVACSCGAVNNADLMVDLRAVPLALRSLWGFGDYACSNCRTTAFREGRVLPSVLFHQLGAPIDVVTRAQSHYDRTFDTPNR